MTTFLLGDVRDKDEKLPAEVVADARNELGQYENAASLYYKVYYAARRSGGYIKHPAIFPIVHKMTQAWIESGDESDLRLAHGKAQQNMMPGRPVFIIKDLQEVEKAMREKGREVKGFGKGGFGY